MKKKIYSYKHRMVLLLCLLAFAGISQTKAQCIIIKNTLVHQPSNTLVTAPGIYAGQSFKAPCTGLLNKIVVYDLHNQTGVHFMGNVNVFKGEGPTGTLLAGENFDAAVGDSADVNIVFSTPISVTADTSYTIFFSTSVPQFLFFNYDDYPDGGLYQVDHGTVHDYSSFDLAFKLYVTPPCTPTTSSKDTSICPSALPFTWEGFTFTAAGSKTKTGLSNAAGCDSTATFNVIVNAAYTPGNIILTGATFSSNYNTSPAINQTYVPTGISNGTQYWTYNTNNSSFGIIFIVWDGSQWVVNVQYRGYFLINTTGSATYLPATGWQIFTNNPYNYLLTVPAFSGSTGTIVLPPKVQIAATATTIAPGTSVTFTATPTNGGATLAYQWKKNGADISGAKAPTYTTTALANGDVVTCVLTSTSACSTPVTATSNDITMTETPTCTPTASTKDSSICPSALPFTWEGFTFTAAGSKTKTGLTNAAGCDSTATFKVIVKANTTSDTTATACNMFTWHGVVYTTSGDKIFDTTNAAGCDSIRTLHLTINTVPVTTSITPALCYGSGTGSITLSATNNFPPFIYRISSGDTIPKPDGPSHTFNNLKAGTYRVYVTDSTGCTGVAGGLVVLQNAKVTAKATGTPLSCFGSADGKIRIENPVGTSPFQYKIGAIGPLTSFTAPVDITGKAAGNYGIYVVDANGCSSTGIVVPVTQPAKVSATLAATDVTGCNGDNSGTLTLSNPMGNGSFKYKMNSGGTYAAFTPPVVLNGVKANNYSFFIQDGNGCVGKTNIVTVSQPAPTPVNYTAVQPTCRNSTGFILLSTSNTAGATYKINPGSSIYTSQNFYQNLAPGTYYGYVKDAAGCVGRSVAIVLVKPANCSTLMGKATQQSNRETAGTTLSASISPNPSSNVFKLRANTAKAEAIQLRVIDVNGKVVYTAKGSPTQAFTFGEALTVGVYMIEVRQGNEVKTYKVVKTL